MRLNQWLLQKETEWGRLESLLEKSRGSIYRLSSDEIRTLTLLYRSLLNDLTRVKSTSEHQGLIPYLNQLACQTQAKLSENKPQRLKDILTYFMVTFPQCFRRNWKFMAAATSTFLIGTTLAMLTVYYDPSTEGYFLPPFLIESLSSGKLWTDAIQAAPSESTFLMANNIRVAIMAFTYGLLFGIGSLFVLFQNGMTAFGGPLQVCFNHGVGSKLVLFMIPHGVIELSTIMIAGGAGLMLGYALLFPGNFSRWDALQIRGKEALILMGGCIPLLVMAGIIEGIVSLNPDVLDIGRIAISIFTAIFLILYLGFSGRRSSERRSVD